MKLVILTLPTKSVVTHFFFFFLSKGFENKNKLRIKKKFLNPALEYTF